MRSTGDARRRGGEKRGGEEAAQRGEEEADLDQSSISDIFPWYAIYLVLTGTLVTRLSIVTNEENWWLLHPGEVYQTLEVAHSEVYGYGFRPYEYLPPPARDGEGEASFSEQARLAAGLSGRRSWLVPRVYVAVFSAASVLGINAHPFKVVKVSHALVCCTLPLAVFLFTRLVTQGSRDAGVLAAAVAACCGHLALLGTHTVATSVVSPALFFTMYLIIRGLTEDAAGAITLPHQSQGGPDSDSDYRNTWSAPGHNDLRVTKSATGHRADLRTLLLSGSALGLLLYALPDTSLTAGFCLTCFAVRTNSYPGRLQGVAVLMLGVVAGVLFGGYDDWVSYGVWFISPLQWLRLQGAPAVSPQDSLSQILSRDITLACMAPLPTLVVGLHLLSAGFRRSLLALAPRGKPILYCMCVSYMTACSLMVLHSLQGHKEFVHDALVLLLVSCACAVVILFHTLVIAVSEDPSKTAPVTLALKVLLYGEIILYGYSTKQSYPAPTAEGLSGIVYGGVWESGEVNSCLYYVSQQEDVTGVFIDLPIHMTGGYTLLHKDVPVLARTHEGFREWGHDARDVVSSSSLLGGGGVVSIATLDRVSNFISADNAPLAIKSYIDDQHYNYAVISGGRQFLPDGHDRVFTAGGSRVYRRWPSAPLTQLSRRIPVGRNSTVLQAEVSWLAALGLTWKARERAEYAAALEPSSVRAWQLLFAVSDLLGDEEGKAEAVDLCVENAGEEACRMDKANSHLYSEYKLHVVM